MGIRRRIVAIGMVCSGCVLDGPQPGSEPASLDEALICGDPSAYTPRSTVHY